MSAVIKGASYALFHVPDLVQYGSKPSRDIQVGLVSLKDLRRRLRDYQSAQCYAPNQVFIGNVNPDALHEIQKPWYENPLEGARRAGPFGEILPEIEFYAWLLLADQFNLIWLTPEFRDEVISNVKASPFLDPSELKKRDRSKAAQEIEDAVRKGFAIPLEMDGQRVGSIRRDHDLDDTLKSHVLLENLAAKASGSWAMLNLFQQTGINAGQVDYVLDCTETAIGDRYNRGGGSLSKAMAEMCGCANATGSDVRAFCCGPNHALLVAASLVEAGLFNHVVVAGGGCLAKLGMKYAAHLKHEMPILEDVLATMAFLISRDDGESPVIRLDTVGKHNVGAGFSQQAIMTSLISEPLSRMGWRFVDIDRYSTELHNPEITLPAGSGDTPATNYRIIASLAAMQGEIAVDEIDVFIKQRGMLGYVPTQGHIPSAVPYLGHAMKAMGAGEMQRVMFIGKGSIFLGRMSRLSDGISFVLEKNPQAKACKGKGDVAQEFQDIPAEKKLGKLRKAANTLTHAWVTTSKAMLRHVEGILDVAQRAITTRDAGTR